MFPVYTGINRVVTNVDMDQRDVPCIHRDKPDETGKLADNMGMFPVYTGINRKISPSHFKKLYVPCIHRDKPHKWRRCSYSIKCSLYTQG